MRIKKKLKRSLSLLIIAVMLVTSGGVTTFADDVNKVITEDIQSLDNQSEGEDYLNKDDSGPLVSTSSESEAYDTECSSCTLSEEPLDGDVIDDSETATGSDDFEDAEEATSSDIDSATSSIAIDWEAEREAAAKERAISALELGYVPGEIIIEYDSTCSVEYMQTVAAVYGGEIIRILMESDTSDFAQIKISDDLRVDTAVTLYEELPDIVSAGKNAVLIMSSYEINGLNDTHFNELYHLKSDNGSNRRGANVLNAWDTLTAYQNEGNTLSSVGVAVIDTGCQYTNEDLDGAVDTESSYELWFDGYGRVSDYLHSLLGDNYNNGNPGSDELTHHGTHVTGIIGAKANNNKGVAGAASVLGDKLNLSVIDAACYYPSIEDDGFTTDALIKAIDTAYNSGSRIVNMSLGAVVGTENRSDYDSFESAIKAKAAQGMIFVCAAGNGNINTHYKGTDLFTIPSDYDSVISVINTQADGIKNSSSNYGVAKDVSAPGTDIYSTYGKSYASLTGTSMSAPLVTGIVALMRSVDPDLTPNEVRTILMDTTTDLGDAGFDPYYAAGLVNADAAVKAVIDGMRETDSETTDNETTDSETTDSETTDSETTDSETTDSETTDSEATDSETTDSETTDNETTDSETTDNETTDNETTDSEADKSETTGGSSGNNSDGSGNSGNRGSGGSGGSGGGGGGGGGTPIVIEGTAQVNPLTGKRKFVTSAGKTYRNAWNTVDMYDAGGGKHKIRIYTDANGDIAAGWQWIRCSDGQIRCFYFSNEIDGAYGECYTDRTLPGGYTIDSNGYWTVDGVVQLSDKETVTRVPVNDPAEIAAAAAERAKSPAELGYIPDQIIAAVSGTRQQIDAYVAAMGGKVISVLSTDNGTSTVLINIADNTTVSTAQELYRGNPLFKSVGRNAVLTMQ